MAANGGAVLAEGVPHVWRYVDARSLSRSRSSAPIHRTVPREGQSADYRGYEARDGQLLHHDSSLSDRVPGR